MKQRFSLAVHGGAGRLAASKARDPERLRYDQALARALAAGAAVLRRGGSAVRAVTAAVVVLEDDELFNAGRGAALCADGSAELSASVMNGETSKVGAMVGLRRTKNPVLAARALLGHSHCLLFGSSGDAFAQAHGLEMVSRRYFVTRMRRRQWERLRDRSRVHPVHGGTVGAVARDRRGRLAAATSTGGMLNQLAGRVGDSPVAGAGTWASRVCALSATGTGDAFFQLAFARRVADLIELAALSPREALERGLEEIRAARGHGGCIGIDAEGRITCAFNSPLMVRGWLAEGEPMQVAIRADDARVVPARRG